MPIVKITGQGIAAIGLSVTLLWACWFSTRLTMEEAQAERVKVMRELDRHQSKPAAEPVTAPVRHRPYPYGVTAG